MTKKKLDQYLALKKEVSFLEGEIYGTAKQKSPKAKGTKRQSRK